jgi:homoaconitase/3-isopropylmalate dehydratase large subunit
MEETFIPVDEKLKAAEYFLDNLRTLEKEAKHLSSADPLLTRVNLDGFFFEVIAAKDLFLQLINKLFKTGFKSGKVRQINYLARILSRKQTM